MDSEYGGGECEGISRGEVSRFRVAKMDASMLATRDVVESWVEEVNSAAEKEECPEDEESGGLVEKEP